MAITAAEFALFLEPKLANIWHDAFPSVEATFEKVFNIRDMNKNTITDAKMAGFGALQDQPDGADVQFDDPIAPITKEYTYVVRALAYRIHERMWLNELYDQAEKLEMDLRDSAIDDAEVEAWGEFNDGFSGSTSTGFDGLALFSTAHTRLDGGATQSNRPSTDEALTMAALENAVTMMRRLKNDRGRPRAHKPRKLIAPPEYEFTAKELLRSTQQPENNSNAVNAIRDYSLELVISEYLTSTTAWFVQADKHDLNWFWRFRAKTGMRTDFHNDSIERKVRQAHAHGFGEWRGNWGTDGTA